MSVRRWAGAGLVLASVLAMSPVALAQRSTPATVETLVREGDAALDAKRYRDAFDAFASAAALQPRDASLYTAAAFAASMLGQSADATAWLERALQVDPRYTPASVLLGQVLFRQGQVREAVGVYEAALRYAPDDATLNARLREWRADAQLQSGFYEARGAHFSVLFEGPADDLIARKVVELLEQAYYRVGGALSTYPTKTITVVLYTQQQFRDVTRSPGWAGAVYDGRIKLPVVGVDDHGDELPRILEHELVHAVVATMAGPSVPAWVHEGLATTLEPGGTAWSEGVLAQTSLRVPLARLARGFGGLTPEEAAVAYAQSAVAVKRMADLRGMSGVAALIQAMGRGVPFETAFEQTIFMRFDDFTRLSER